jgi:hypothetical protein
MSKWIKEAPAPTPDNGVRKLKCPRGGASMVSAHQLFARDRQVEIDRDALRIRVEEITTSSITRQDIVEVMGESDGQELGIETEGVAPREYLARKAIVQYQGTGQELPAIDPVF